MKSKIEILRSIYLFSISLIGVVMVIFGFISFTSSLVDVIYKTNSLYKVSSLVSSGFSIIVGVFIFVFHWAIIKRENRFNLSKKKKYQSDESFWGSFFFYAVAFIGLMVMSFSFISLGANIFHTTFMETPALKPGTPPNGKLPPPKVLISPDVGGIIKSSISIVIGFFVWLAPWKFVEKLREEELNSEIK